MERKTYEKVKDVVSGERQFLVQIWIWQRKRLKHWIKGAAMVKALIGKRMMDKHGRGRKSMYGKDEERRTNSDMKREIELENLSLRLYNQQVIRILCFMLIYLNR
jgi:hypothetical protein